MVAIAPLAVGQAGEYSDSSTTRFGMAAGTGDFAVVTRGCDNAVISKYHRSFRDASAGVEHEFRGPLVVGVRAQRVSGEYLQRGKADQLLWNPHVALESRRVGVGVGWVTPSGELDRYGNANFDVPPVSAHLRFGDPNRLAVAFRLMEGDPAFSSGGALDVRVSTRIGSRFHPWIGAGGAEPFDAIGFFVGTEASVAPGLQLNVGGRLGGSEGIDENAIRVGLSYSWTHRRYGFQQQSPPPDSFLPTRLTLTLDGGKTLTAISVQPWSMDFVKVVLTNGQETFISAAKVQSIVDTSGTNLKKKVLIERRKVP